MTQNDIAAAAGLTAAAISQFESGVSRPSMETVNRLALVLRFPPQFFIGAVGASVGEDIEGYFRSLRAMSATARRGARAQAQLLSYFARVLEHRVRLPILDVPRFSLQLTASGPEVEEVAEATRNAWRLPQGPIDHVVRSLERHGVVVARFAVDNHDVDAFSVPFPDRPVVVLGSDKGDRVRSRFDAAHELGHLVTHGQAGFGTKPLETQAHRFAAAFLMPANEIRTELPSKADWERLVGVKRKWGVSIAALLRRAHTLNVMSDQTYVQAMKTMSARGWRRSEPGYLGSPETPVMLGLAVQALEGHGISLKQLANEADLPLEEARRFVGAASDNRVTLEL